MSDALKIRIKGSDGLDDAPPADDFLRQIGDFLDVLKGVEQAISGSTGAVIQWRITGASRNSPVEIEATPYAREFGVNIDERVRVVEVAVSAGLAQISAGGPRPPFFSEATLEKVERMSERVLNGLAQTDFDFPSGIGDFQLTHTTARKTAAAVKAILYPVEKPYEELGSIEGYYAGLEKDGFGRGVIWVKHRITGDKIKCVLSDTAMEQVGEHKGGEILKSRRITVSGRIYYRSLGSVKEVKADNVRLLRSTGELPTLADIQDPNFTGGLLSEEYLARLRDGRLS